MGDISREALFAANLEKVRRIAREQGNCISAEQVREAFSGLGLSGGQLQMVLDYLVKHKVGVNESVDLDSFLTNQERDYLQDYLDEIGRLPAYSEGGREAVTIAAMAGDRQARKCLTEIYLKDVVDIAKLYTGQGVFFS